MTDRDAAAASGVDAAAHWAAVWDRIDPDAASWARPDAGRSAALVHAALTAAGTDPTEARVVDAGGGASPLVDELLDLGVGDVTVVDLADAALEHARARLEGRAGRVTWRVADVRDLDLAGRTTVWHDRAVLHFLVEPADAARYVDAVDRSLAPHGRVVIGGFAPDGPTHCSGLPVRRDGAPSLAALFAPRFTLERTEDEVHRTPAGAEQRFLWAVLRRSDRVGPTRPRTAPAATP